MCPHSKDICQKKATTPLGENKNSFGIVVADPLGENENPFGIGAAAPLGENKNPFEIGGATPLGENENLSYAEFESGFKNLSGFKWVIVLC